MKQTFMEGRPQTVSKDDWYYEGLQNILIIHRVYDSEKRYLRTDEISIPWWRLERSRKRVLEEVERMAAKKARERK
jgi:hypothetical protein